MPENITSREEGAGADVNKQVLAADAQALKNAEARNELALKNAFTKKFMEEKNKDPSLTAEQIANLPIWTGENDKVWLREEISEERNYSEEKMGQFQPE